MSNDVIDTNRDTYSECPKNPERIEIISYFQIDELYINYYFILRYLHGV